MIWLFVLLLAWSARQARGPRPHRRLDRELRKLIREQGGQP